ncbi:MAG TPA: hypothetical protein PKW17_10810 [Smithellaceae bacterium]|nr:hypothetical protein [Smithellaceae bacterium]
MNIVIPEILSGGKGREMQRSSKAIGDAVARGAQAVQNIYDQAGYIEAKKLDNDMNVELNVLYEKEAAATDGTNPNLTAEVRAKADSIYNKYAAQTNNSTAKEKLKYAYEARVANYSQSLDSHNIKMLWKTTMDGVKIKVAESVRMAGQTGDLTGGEEAIRKDLETQRNFFGGRYDAVSRTAMSLYYSNAIPASLYNPQTRGATIAQLDDPKYKERYYKYLDAEQIRAVEYHYGIAKKQVGEQQAFWEIGSKYGTNYEAAYKYVLSPAAGKKYNLSVDQQQNIASSFAALANTQKQTAKARDEETDKTLMPLALNGTISMANIGNSTLSRERKEIYASIIQTPVSETGFKTNPVTEAKLGDRIFSDPENVSDLEIALHVGRGLSRTDAEKLIKQRDYFIRDKIPEHQKTQAKVIYDALEDDYKAGVFGDKEKRSSSIEYARKKSQFQRWLIQNPDKEPAQWYEEIIGQEQKNFIGRFLDWAAEVRNKPLEREKAEAKAGQKKETPKKKYKAKMADGTMIYSDDGNNWYDDKGTKVE